MVKLHNKIGVIVDCFKLGLHEGLLKAKEVGADGVQIWATKGEMAPENLSVQARKELKARILDMGLEIPALCGDLGGHGFQDKSANPDKIEKSKRILDLAVDLGADVVTTHIGVVPDNPNEELYEIMHKACEELASYASSLNAYFAIETGPETAEHLKSFLDTLSTKGVAVNFDPANMVMVTGDDPANGVRILKDYIVHTHVKDGIRLREVDPRLVYGTIGYEPLDHERIEQEKFGRSFRELPAGEGKVDFDAYFAALAEVGYSGYLTVEREAGTNRVEDIRKAVELVKRYK